VTEQLWPLLTVLSFWGWVGAVVGFILSSFPAGGIFRYAPALRWGGAFLFLFLLWFIGMARS
jgi:hypothetical protein